MAFNRNMNNPFERIQGDEYVEWVENRHERNDRRITLEEAKSKIRVVQMNEFYTIFENTYIPNYLIDVYYFHYLCMKGDIVRIENFILDLQNRNIEVARVANYPVPEFDYGNILHTVTRWNNDIDLFEYILQDCQADITQRDSFGFSPSEIADYDDFIYSFPFTDYLGEGESPVENDIIYRRIEENFDQMRIKMNGIEQELDAQQERMNHEEREENIGVIIPPQPQFPPQLQRQNGFIFEDEFINDLNNNNDNIRRELFPANNNHNPREHMFYNHNNIEHNMNEDIINF